MTHDTNSSTGQMELASSQGMIDHRVQVTKVLSILATLIEQKEPETVLLLAFVVGIIIIALFFTSLLYRRLKNST